MMPAAKDDLASKEAAQNNKNTTMTSRHAGTRKPTSSSPQNEPKHPPSSSTESEGAPPLQLTLCTFIDLTPPRSHGAGTLMGPPVLSSMSGKDYLAK
jgi:hypothetical protein